LSDTAKRLLTCVTCGKMYSGCRTCEEARDKGLFMWRQSCDTPECFQVHMIVKNYYDKVATKKVANEQLEGILTEEMKPYESNARWLIEEIMAEPLEEEVKPKVAQKQIPKNVK
jgi:hypothetical protein